MLLPKTDLPLAGKAYLHSTGANYAAPHPNVIDLQQATIMLSRTKTSPVSNTPSGAFYTPTQPSPLDHGLYTLQNLNVCPWYNGSMPHLNLSPEMLKCIDIANQHGIIYQPNPMGIYAPNGLKQFISQFQDSLLTRSISQSQKEWNEAFKSTAVSFDVTFKQLPKDVLGFEMSNFKLVTTSDQLGSPQLDRAISAATHGIINTIDPNRLLTIFLKTEVNFYQQVKLRFIILLKRDYIDDPTVLSDFSLFEKLKLGIQQSSFYTINYEPVLLNGYLNNGLFHKNSATFKDQLKQLKVYLVGTDALFRVAGNKPTFEILYEKYKKTTTKGVRSNGLVTA
ncbi:hypothetical protein [Acinetobacter puyangensis]|uniref:hypothetical protein n=1 Tax=Acinetobacter puyangensis TaxID=1096779 RepID=UPI003A4E4892